ncbi:MAG: hypothetical protein WCJ66_05830 [Verrucomicrobiota bacterium]
MARAARRSMHGLPRDASATPYFFDVDGDTAGLWNAGGQLQPDHA